MRPFRPANPECGIQHSGVRREATASESEFTWIARYLDCSGVDQELGSLKERQAGMDERRTLLCDTCGTETDHLHRDVLDKDYNALMRPPIWNCEACYEKKRAERLERQQDP